MRRSPPAEPPSDKPPPAIRFDQNGSLSRILPGTSVKPLSEISRSRVVSTHRGWSDQNDSHDSFQRQSSLEDEEFIPKSGHGYQEYKFKRNVQEPPAQSDMDDTQQRMGSQKRLNLHSHARKEDPPDETVHSHDAICIENKQKITSKISSDRGCGSRSLIDNTKIRKYENREGGRTSSEKSPQKSVLLYPDSNNLNQTNCSHSSKKYSISHLEDEYPLLEMEEDLYERYQDELFHHSSFEQQPLSSQYGQFSIAPMYEMTQIGSKKTKKLKDTPEKYVNDKKWQWAKPAIKSNYSVMNQVHGGSKVFDNDNNSDERAEEFYNYDNESENENEEEYEDLDEEMPLQRSKSLSSLNDRHPVSVSSILSRSETCLNRTILVAFVMVCLVFVRDHTTWWKKHQSRVALQRYQDTKTALDPMTVYNSNDDDSTHPRDHDPTHKYTKYTAGERISDRPPQKSLNHGFMDEIYENRPAGKNSGLTTAIQAGVNDSENEADEETSSYLESVIRSPGKSDEKVAFHENGEFDKELADNKNSDSQNISLLPSQQLSEETLSSNLQNGGKVALPENPPPKSVDSYEGAISQGISQSTSAENTNTTVVANIDNGSMGHNDKIEDNFESNVGTLLMTQPQNVDVTGTEVNDVVGSSIAQYTDHITDELSFSQTPNQSKITQAINGDAFISSSINAQAQERVKDTYKDTFYRWNHPFRADRDSENGKDVPVFWRIPRSASGVLETVMSYCYGLTLASAIGTSFGHNNDTTLSKINVPAGALYVNVDVSTPSGIERAVSMGLGSSGMADVISSPFIYETTNVFRGISESGKCFTLLRHPISRAVSLYHYYQENEADNLNVANYKGLTIDEFAEKVAENNWMVRFLTNKRSGTLTWHDLEAAKEVFGRKCLVGLTEKIEESIRRYERFFYWDGKFSDPVQKEECLMNTLTKHDKRQEHPTYEETNAWEVLRKKNEYDVLLYEYAKNLYSQQSIIYEKVK